MEWNRWLNVDFEIIFYENIMKEIFSEECLDIVLVFQDQKVFFRFLKMVEFFLEIREFIEEEFIMNGEVSWEEMGGVVGGVDVRLVLNDFLLAINGEMVELS